MAGRLPACVLLAALAISACGKKEDASGAEEEAGGVIKGPIVGIDLGTTYSCVAIFRNGRVEIIANDQGNRITPSYVAFTDEERLVGEAAKNEATIHPTQTVYDVKRLIGRRFKEKSVQKDMALLPFKVVERDGKPFIEVKVAGKDKKMAPEEISAMVLGRMKETAESFLGSEVKHAVITVPAYFNDAQRTATKNAGAIAGLDVLRIINEPTAAAIAYGLDQKGEQNILVYDLGGGTFDVSLLTIDNGVFEVTATSGDTHLGGEDFDHRIMNHFMKLCKDKHKKDLSKDKRALQKLKREVEKAKRALSTTFQTRVEIENVAEGTDMSEVLTRAKFEELNADLFKSTLKPVEKVLEDSGMDKADISEVVLVGGSTRIPKIQELLSGFFDGKELNKGVNPDEAVAYGAAVQGGVIGGSEDMGGKELLLLDVTPLSLGTEIKGGGMSVVIPRGTTIPTEKTSSFTTTEDYQSALTFPIYEGERAMAKNNHLLGSFTLSGLPPVKKGVPSIELTYKIDKNGILSCKAQDKATGKGKAIKVTSKKNKLSEAEIERMVKDAERYAEQDKVARERMDALRSYENYVDSMVRTIEDSDGIGKKCSPEEKATIKKAVAESQAWLASRGQDASAEQLGEKKSELEETCQPIIAKYYGGPSGSGEDGSSGAGDDDEDYGADEL